VRVNDGGDGVRRIVKAVDELEPQRDEQRDAEQHIRIGSRVTHHGQIVREVEACVYDARDDDDARENVEPGIRPVTEERGCL
jgi:hypothetical protein